MDDEFRIHLEADDNASADIGRVENAFDKLREKYRAMASEMESHGLNISTEGLEATIKRVEVSLAGMFDRIGAHEEAMAARLWVATDRALEKQAQAAQRAANEAIAAAERRAQGEAKAREESFFLVQAENQRLQKMREQESQAALRGFNDVRSVEQKAAAAEAKAHEDTFFLVQDLNQKTAKLADDRADKEAAAALRATQAEHKYREDLFFFVQEQNHRLIQEEERRASREAQLGQQQMARFRGMGGGGIGRGDITGLLGNLGGAGRGIGRAGLGAIETGLGAIGNAAKGVTGIFTSLGEAVTHAGGRMGEFISIGVGIASLYEIVNMVERAFHAIGGAITEFQDKMVQVQSLRIGESIGTEAKAGFEDLKASVLEVSMTTGRSATELGNALFFIEGHTYKGAEALIILDKAAKLAASGLGETDQLIRVVTGQMVAYGAKAEEAGHYFDVFAKTEQAAALPIGELSGQFQRLNPITAALKIPIEQVGAAIATISQTGLGASRVVTDLAAVLNSFIHSSPQQQTALKRIGYPIEEVRKDLTDPGKGLLPVLEEIWRRAEHDIDAVGTIFSDRGRALVGFLALVRQSGSDLNDTYSKFANTAGTVDKIFAVNQERISLQWARMTTIAQAYGIMLTNDLAPKVGAAMGAIADAFQKGDISGAFQQLGKMAQDAFGSVITMLDTLARDAFGGAYNIAVEIAKGLWEGANDAINAVVNAIADMIASFLLGHSWTPKGPLSAGDAGVKGLASAYAKAWTDNQNIITGAVSNVAAAVSTEMGKIGAVGSKEAIQNAIAGIDMQLLPWKLAADSIKDAYEQQLRPLEMQIGVLQRIKDIEYERKQLKFEERDLELRLMHIRAEGDPRRRAELAGQLARAQEQREQHSIDSRLATLNREARNLRPGRGTTAQEIGLRRREIADEINILHIQQQQHRLVNVQLLGQYETKKAQLDVDKDIADIQHSQFELERKERLQPLLEQRDLLKNKMQAELDVIKLQTDGLEDQRKILEAQLKVITAREAGQKKAAGGGAGVFKVPETDDPLSLQKKLQEGIDTIAGEMAKGLDERLRHGLSTFASNYGPVIGESFIGFMVGGMVAGLPGAVAGAALVPKLINALAERGVTGADFTYLANSVVADLRNAFGRVGDKLRAGDILGSVESLMADVQVWVHRFQTAFFSEWQGPGRIKGIQGDPSGDVLGTIKNYSETAAGQRFIEENIGGVGTQRYTGIGRSIVEGISGGIIHEDLTFKDLDEAIKGVFRKIIAHLTEPQVLENEIGGVAPMMGQSVIGRMFSQIGAAISTAMSEATVGINQNLPEAQAGAKSAGVALGQALFGDMEDTFNKGPSDNLLAAATRAGVAIGGAFIVGFASKIPVIGGVVKFMEWLNSFETPDVLGTQKYFQTPFRPAGVPGPNRAGAPNPVGGAVGGVFAGGATVAGTFGPPAEVQTLGADAAGGILQGFRDAWASDTSFKDDNSRFWRENVVLTAQDVLEARSPSQVFKRLGDDVLAGFQDVISGDNTTGAIVRMWLRSEVIAQAQQILITGEGKGGGGLAAVGIDAVQAFSDAFATPPAGLAEGMRALGRTAAEALMEPLEDSRTGVIARMRKIIDAMPKAPAAPTPAGGGGDRNVMAATGADFIVGGTGGTDSERMSLWATPGERVQVGSNGGRNVNNTFHINVNGGDPDEVREAIAAGIREGTGNDESASQLLNAWRTAKAQGQVRSIGTQSRGARG